MIRYNEKSEVPIIFFNSTETAPTDDSVLDGTTGYEKDTGKHYTYAKETQTWEEGSYFAPGTGGEEPTYDEWTGGSY